jgi:hypothetical protein
MDRLHGEVGGRGWRLGVRDGQADSYAERGACTESPSPPGAESPASPASCLSQGPPGPPEHAPADRCVST